MSWLSVALKDLGTLFSQAASQTPEAQKALADLQTAATSVQAAAPALVDAAVDDALNAMLSKIPILGTLAEGEVDDIANKFLASLYAKVGMAAKTVVAAAETQVQAAMQDTIGAAAG